MVVKLAFPYRLRPGQRVSGTIGNKFFISVRTKAWSPARLRWERVQATKFWRSHGADGPYMCVFNLGDGTELIFRLR